MIQINNGLRLCSVWTLVEGTQPWPGQDQIPAAKRGPVSTPRVWAELGIRAPRWKGNNIGYPSQKGRSVTHLFSMCGNCTHSVKATSLSAFYSCVRIIPGLCILAAKGILAIVTVILIASICLSATLFLFVWGFFIRCWEVEEWMRVVLQLTPGAVQLSQLPPLSFHFPSTPICLLCAPNLSPIQVHVCRSGPSHATLNPFKVEGGKLELTFQLRHCR